MPNKSKQFAFNRKAVLLILFIIILFHMVNNLYIVSKHDNLPSADAAFYLSTSLRMYNLLKQGDMLNVLKVSDWPVGSCYGPLFYLITQPFFFAFGGSVGGALMLNNMFFILLILSTFLLGTRLFSEKTGLLAAFLVSFYPQVFGMSRVYIRDFALLAMICLDLYLLLKTENFTKSKQSILLGLIIGLTALIKPTAALYLVGPVLFIFFHKLISESEKNKLRVKIKNLLITSILSVGLYLTWFFRYPEEILSVMKTSIEFQTTQQVYGVFDITNILYWPKIIIQYQLLYFFGSIFLITFIMFLFNKKISSKNKLFLTSLMFIVYIFFTFIASHNRSWRFMMPLVIPVAIITAAAVMQLTKKHLRNIFITIIVLIGISQFFILCYSSKLTMSLIKDDPNDLMNTYFDRFRFRNRVTSEEWSNGVFIYQNKSLGQDIVLRRIIQDVENKNKSYEILLSDFEYFSPIVFLVELYGVEYLVPKICDRDQYKKPDYFLFWVEGKSIIDSRPENYFAAEDCINSFFEDKDSYSKLDTIKNDVYFLPHRYTIEIYKRKSTKI